MQFDNDKICKTFKVSAEEIGTIDGQHESRAGKTFEFLVNGAPLVLLKTKNAVAADYISFMDGVLKAMLNDTESLEKEANMSGKTIKHANFEAFGALPITETKDP